MNSLKTTLKQIVQPILALLMLFLIWLIPSSSYQFIGLDIIQQRVLMIFILALFLWVTEIIPGWVTSISITTLLLLTVSDNSLSIFKLGSGNGQIMSSTEIISSFADPIIFLFIGGFVIAAVATKFSIDKTIVNLVIRFIGVKSKWFLLGIMAVTVLCSMFISNTATAIMMLAIISPMLKQLDENDKGRTALVLGVAAAANFGGLGTPIGTPPNAIVLKYLNDPSGLNLDISFFDWMVLFLPITILLVFISWIILINVFPFKYKELKSVSAISTEGDNHPKVLRYIVYIILLITVLMWCLDRLFGVNANVVAFIPICMFSLLGIFNRKDLSEIDWSVLWLVAGGFALGLAFQETGLAYKLISSINFSAINPLVVMITCWLISWGLSNVISNTASATLIAPIFITLAISIAPEIVKYGGPKMLMLGVALFTSLAMVLPISTPPNALIYSTGYINKKHMQYFGLIMGAVGFVMAISCILFL